MYTVKTDVVKNRVYMTLEGTTDMAEAKRYENDVRNAADKLKPGFTIILDGRKAHPFAPEINDYLADLRQYLVTKGVKETATVVDSALIKMHAKRSIKDMGGTGTFASIEEAEKYLDSLNK